MDFQSIFIKIDEEWINFLEEVGIPPIESPSKDNGWSFIYKQEEEYIICSVAKRYPSIKVGFR